MKNALRLIKFHDLHIEIQLTYHCLSDNMSDISDIDQIKENHEQEPVSMQKILRHIEIRLPEAKTPERLDVFLARQVAEITRSKAREMITTGQVKIDGMQVKPSHKVRPNELITLDVLSRPPLDLLPEPIPLEVVWEDEYIVVINKPAGMVVHPAAGNRTGTLVNALLSHYGELAEADDPDRPGMVHRLDKDTSGLLVVCKREPALSKLAKAFRDRKVSRKYNAIVWWKLSGQRGKIDKPLGRHPKDRRKYSVRSDGKNAVTNWMRFENFSFTSFIELKLETGRTHQIRVHLADEGHPVFGDPTYGGRNRQMGKLTSGQRRIAAEYLGEIDRQMLHAKSLGFEHPVTGQQLSFDSDLPDDFTWLLERLRSRG